MWLNGDEGKVCKIPWQSNKSFLILNERTRRRPDVPHHTFLLYGSYYVEYTYDVLYIKLPYQCVSTGKDLPFDDGSLLSE